MKLEIEINFDFLEGLGFAGFIKDSVKKEGKAQILIDFNAMLNCVTDNKELSFKELFADSVVHEILHSIEEMFDKSFDEERIEKAIEAARKYERKK
jgi:hypothetical protein